MIRLPLAHLLVAASRLVLYWLWGGKAGLRGRLLRTGLFDSAFYTARHPESCQGDPTGLDHYLAEGDALGYAPNPLFDPRYYRRAAFGLPLASANSLLHYLFIGGSQGLAPSSRFDPAYYLACNADVRESGMDPLRHYLRKGRLEGRHPTPGYEVQALEPEPPDATEPCEVPGVLPLRERRDEPPVDIVVPAPREAIGTLRCLRSVLRATSVAPFALTVVTDACTPPAILRELDELEAAGLVACAASPQVGPIACACQGLALRTDRDMVILVPESLVFNDWLDRLRRCAMASRSAACVAPLSNAYGLCGYPLPDANNDCPLELEPGELDALAATTPGLEYVAAPLLAGPCLYLSRACRSILASTEATDANGQMDSVAELSARARGLGCETIVCPSVFVSRQYGRADVGERERQRCRAEALLEAGHPDLVAGLARFQRENQLASARRRLDEARRQRQAGESATLLLTHTLGGGTERYVRELAERLRASGQAVFVARPWGAEALFVVPHAARHLPNLTPLRLDDAAAVMRLFSSLNIQHVQVHHLSSLHPLFVERFLATAKAAGADVLAWVHDYLALCPHITLVNPQGLYCCEPTPEGCRRCMEVTGQSAGHPVDIETWRERHGRVLAQAGEVLVPDEDVRRRMARHFPNLPLRVSPLEPAIPAAPLRSRPRADRTRVVTPGRITVSKGFGVLAACARDAEARSLPLDFVVMGTTCDDSAALAVGITVTGTYREADAARTLAALKPDVLFLPSVWPETYCYTLSLALGFGLPIAAFDLGAQASRLRAARPDAMLLDIVLAQDAGLINTRILALATSSSEG